MRESGINFRVPKRASNQCSSSHLGAQLRACREIDGNYTNKISMLCCQCDASSGTIDLSN